jgi:predicted dehydrogenase
MRGKVDSIQTKPLLYGMVGGAEGSLIGEVHRIGAAFDGRSKLAAGCFSRDYTKTLAIGERLHIDRLYETPEQMAEQEASRADGIRYAVIVTPNDSHYGLCKLFLSYGFHVVCDKPLALTVKEAEELDHIARDHGLLLAVTHTYCGYPMVKEMKQRIRQGDIGSIVTVIGEYAQEWVARTADLSKVWRLDPVKQGMSCCIGDIGVHLAQLVNYAAGLEVQELCALTNHDDSNQRLDTNAHILLKYTNGASGEYWCSQIAHGHMNGLRVRFIGTTGTLEWEQESPDRLKWSRVGEPVSWIHRGRDRMSPTTATYNRLPGGHPEGFHVAFANLYSDIADEIEAIESRKSVDAGNQLQRMHGDYVPDARDGVFGVKFIHRCMESARKGSQWIHY